jgi:hypothetical protein
LTVNHPTVQFRFASICYGDPVDSKSDKHESVDFSGNVSSLKTFLSGVVADGGLI